MKKRVLHIDIETFSSVDIMACGSYKYFESPDFEILIIAYAFEDDEVRVLDLAQGDKIPDWFIVALRDEDVEKHAHNANFERNAFLTYGFETPTDQWHCSAVKSAYCGLPLSLGQVSKALQLNEFGKSSEGKALIKLFSCPVKPSKSNGMQTRVYPSDQPEKWERYKEYCRQDVVAEREILNRLDKYKYPESERTNYLLDQEINDRGIEVDLPFAQSAFDLFEEFKKRTRAEMIRLSGVTNPNSVQQLSRWIESRTGLTIKGLNKETLPSIIEACKDLKPLNNRAHEPIDLNNLSKESVDFLTSRGYTLMEGKWFTDSGDERWHDYKEAADDTIKRILEKHYEAFTPEKGSGEKVTEVLRLKKGMAKTSVAKYKSMLGATLNSSRAHGLFQFYGANRTGRWAGRLVQMQNLPQNHLSSKRDPDGLQNARDIINTGDFELCDLMYADIPSVLSQLIRTAFVAPKGKTFAVADFSAIEARVIAWLSGESWRIRVFNSHGKIYEASASKMFDVPIEVVTKGSDYRAKGKVAELALGYGGSIGALRQMGAEKMGLSVSEMDTIVKKWRKANRAIVAMWYDLEGCAIRAVETRRPVKSKHKDLLFECNGEVLTIKLPSGRRLFYQSPSFTTNQWGNKTIRYKGMDQTTKQWGHVTTYGGKLTENIVQAIARDLLADAMLRVDAAGFPIVMHVHDEMVVEVLEDNAEKDLKDLCKIMGESSEIYDGVPYPAEGYLTPYYKKD